MAELTNEQMDSMSPQEIQDALRLVLAYAQMKDLIACIRTTYIEDDRLEIAEAISEPSEDEVEDSVGLDDFSDKFVDNDC
jgi:hypothetical protein